MSTDEPNEPPLRNGGALRWTRFVFLIGIALYLFAVWYFGWQEVRDILVAADPRLVALSAALILAGTWARAFKWQYTLGPGHAAAGLFFMSKAAGNWSPGRLAEFAPMAFRRHRTPRMGAWILLDRLMEIVVTLALGLWGLALIELVSPSVYGVLVVTATAGCALALYTLTRRGIFLWAAARSREPGWIHRTAMLLAAASGELQGFLPKLPLAASITILAKCGDLFAVSLLFRGFGFTAGFALVSAAKCALAIVSFLPLTPSPTGIPHLTQAWLMNSAAGIPYEGLTATIGMEVVIISVTFWTSFGLATPLMRAAAATAEEH